MLAVMRHRGPDDSGIFGDERVTLGMTRLAIIDTSAAGHQPMSTENEGVCIVYNGETYNFREERVRLERAGVRFRSHSDTEVLLRLYEERGDDFVTHLRGMFALAVYDRRGGPGRERLVLARDPLGIKPLLYAETPGGGLVFASELKALLASALVRPEIDADAIRMLMSFGSVPQPMSVIRGVRMLPAGHRLVITPGAIARPESYWRLDVDRENVRRLPYQEQVARVRDAVCESLKLQLVSDVPLGAFLSGGIDSSILVALMTRHAPGRVKTISVGFESEGASIDESADAERIATYLGTEHYRTEVTARDARERISDLARALDQPSMDGANAYFVSMAARRHVTVAISGTGGDELFAGYPWFGAMAEFARTRVPLRRAACAALARARPLNPLMRSGAAERLEHHRAAGGFLPHYARLHQGFGAPIAARLLSRAFGATAAIGRDPAYDIAKQDELGHATPVARVTALCLRGYTQNQLLRDIDAVSMAHSLEVRVPFLDHRLADLALSLPDGAKLAETASASEYQTSYRASGAKRILLDAFREMLPPGLEDQPKRGFGMPLDRWLRSSLRDVLEDTLSKATVHRRGLFDAHEVQRVRDRFERGTAPWTHPWLLMVTELWCREVVDRASSSLAN